MNTFLNLQQECSVPWMQEEKKRLIKHILSFPLDKRIYLRGLYEQWAVRTHSQADKKRASKNFSISQLQKSGYFIQS